MCLFEGYTDNDKLIGNQITRFKLSHGAIWTICLLKTFSHGKLSDITWINK